MQLNRAAQEKEEEDLETGVSIPVGDNNNSSSSSSSRSVVFSPVPDVSSPPPVGAFLTPNRRMDSVLCVHCNKMTPARIQSPSGELSSCLNENHGSYVYPAPDNQQDPKTPMNRGIREDVNDDLEYFKAELNKRVAECQRDFYEALESNPTVSKPRNKVFRLTSSNSLSKKNLETLEGMLRGDPALLNARSTNMGNMVPDGYTPLMAAAYSGNLDAAKLILEVCPEAISEVNGRGQTALHITSDNGHSKMIDLLIARHKGRGDKLEKLIDLIGRTPYGICLTSTNAKAKQNKKRNKDKLFSPKDVSLMGSPPPTARRVTVCHSLDAVYEESHMPGRRVKNEDAVFSHSWRNHAEEDFVLLGVCDGHSDDGMVSRFVAKNMATQIQHRTMKLGQELSDNDWVNLWNAACLAVDAGLKGTKRKGGSTGVFALVTSTRIIVANIGDSRCILIQSNPLEPVPGVSGRGAIQDNTSGVPELVAEVPSDAVSTTPAGESTGPDDRSPHTSQSEIHAADPFIKPGESQTVAESASARLNVLAADEGTKDEFVVVAMSNDHKPDLEHEKHRIERAGLEVVAETFEENSKEVTIHKVKKTDTNLMAVSRSFGDFEYKGNNNIGESEQAVIALPEVMIHRRDPERDMFLILACDGIWDVMTNEDAAKFVVQQSTELEEGRSKGNGRLATIGDDLLGECFDRGSQDNLTVTVAALSKSVEKFSNYKRIQGKALNFTSEKQIKTADI